MKLRNGDVARGPCQSVAPGQTARASLKLGDRQGKGCGNHCCPGPNGPGLIEAWTAPTPNQAATRCGSFRRTASPRPPALRDPSNRLSSSMLLHSLAGFLVTLEREWESLFDSVRTDLLEQKKRHAQTRTRRQELANVRSRSFLWRNRRHRSVQAALQNNDVISVHYEKFTKSPQS